MSQKKEPIIFAAVNEKGGVTVRP